MPIWTGKPRIPQQEPDFRLLYVGIDQPWLTALRQVLREPEFHIVSCPDRGSAILFLEGDPRYHLLLFELKPHNKTCLELTRLARSLPHREKLPIMIVAGVVTDPIKKRARRAGANECVMKTGEISVTAESIQRLLREHPPVRPY
jgi:response regulator RpfG family c-di-GMP phosphodiesterase